MTAFETADIVNTRTKEERLRQCLLDMRSALDRFHQVNLRFPDNFDELLNGTDPIRGSFFLRRFPINPLLKEPKWEIASRTSLDGSYYFWEVITASNQNMSDSTPIVDVRCPDEAGVGLNRIEYKNW
jgi:hypothetical protein